MQKSEISLVNPIQDLSQDNELDRLIVNFFTESDFHKKNYIYKNIKIAILKNQNINSPEINREMQNYFSKISEPSIFDKRFLKLMLSNGWKVPQNFPENDELNIKESGNDFFTKKIEVKIQDYKKTYETFPIIIQEDNKQAFFDSLKIAFEYLYYCTISSDKNEVENNKENILRINVNGVELGFSAFGLCDFLENVLIKKNQKELSFLEFVRKSYNKFDENFEENFITLKARCILDKQMITDLSFAKEIVENGIDVRSSIESSTRGSLQLFSSIRTEYSTPRNSFQDYFFKSTNDEKKILKFEGDRFVIKNPEPTCYSVLKTIFCSCFGKNDHQKNINIDSLESLNSKPSSDHSLHPSSSFLVEARVSPLYERGDIILS